MIQAYSHYKNGFLPAPGGIYSQTQKFLQAMELIGSMINDFHEKKSKKKPNG